MPRQVPVINKSSCESWDEDERSRLEEDAIEISSAEDVPHTNRSRRRSSNLKSAVRSVEKTPNARSNEAFVDPSPRCPSAVLGSQTANLTTPAARVANMEKSIAQMEKKLEENMKMQQSRKSGTKTRVTVPSHIRSAVRDGFASGKEKGYSWILWKNGIIMKPYLDDNKEMTKHIETFVRRIYPDATEAVLRGKEVQNTV